MFEDYCAFKGHLQIKDLVQLFICLFIHAFMHSLRHSFIWATYPNQCHGDWPSFTPWPMETFAGCAAIHLVKNVENLDHSGKRRKAIIKLVMWWMSSTKYTNTNVFLVMFRCVFTCGGVGVIQTSLDQCHSLKQTRNAHPFVWNIIHAAAGWTFAKYSLIAKAEGKTLYDVLFFCPLFIDGVVNPFSRMCTDLSPALIG